MVCRSNTLLMLHQGIQGLWRLIHKDHRQGWLEVVRDLYNLRLEKNFDLIVRSRITSWLVQYNAAGESVGSLWTPHCLEVLTTYLPLLQAKEAVEATHLIDSFSRPWEDETFEHFVRRRLLWEVLEGSSKKVRKPRVLVDEELVDRVFQIHRMIRFAPEELQEVVEEYFDPEVYVVDDATTTEGGGIWMLNYPGGLYTLNFSIAPEIESSGYSLRVTLKAYPN